MPTGLKKARDKQEQTTINSVDHDVNLAVVSLNEANETEVNEDDRRKKLLRAGSNRRNENSSLINLSPACAALSNQLRFISPSDLAALTSNQANVDNFQKGAESGQAKLDIAAKVQEAVALVVELQPLLEKELSKKSEEVQEIEEHNKTTFVDRLTLTPSAAVAVR